MAFGSVAVWIGVPIGWLWIGSQVDADSQDERFATYVAILAGVVVSVAVMGRLLAILNRAYSRVCGADEASRVRPPWHTSIRDEREPRAPHTVLDTVMGHQHLGRLGRDGDLVLRLRRLAAPGLTARMAEADALVAVPLT
jgi:hypothetical protein